MCLKCASLSLGNIFVVMTNYLQKKKLSFYINITFYILMQKNNNNVPKNRLHFLYEK